MRTGIALLEELKVELINAQNTYQDREDRLDNQEMDLSDCFLSRDAGRSHINELKLKISILENGGLWDFEKLANLDGVIIEKARIIKTRYDICWLADGKFINIPSFGCKAGKHIWINAGFKNHIDAKKRLYIDNDFITDEEYKNNKKLYFKLGSKVQEKGYEAQGYKIVIVKRAAWVSRDGNIFESDFNYFTGE